MGEVCKSENGFGGKSRSEKFEGFERSKYSLRWKAYTLATPKGIVGLKTYRKFFDA